VKNKLHDYVILFQQQKPLSPFSDFILEFCKIEELPRIFNRQYISKRVEDYIISLFRVRMLEYIQCLRSILKIMSFM